MTKKISNAQRYREWKEILKGDEDYDWIFIIKILRYKLERTKKCITSNNIVRDAKKIGKQIQTVQNLLDQVEGNEYFENELTKIEAVYGKRNLKMKTIKSSNHSKFTEVYVTSSWDKLTPKRKSAAEKRVKTAYERSSKKRQTDLDKAFSLMSKNMQSWWD